MEYFGGLFAFLAGALATALAGMFVAMFREEFPGLFNLPMRFATAPLGLLAPIFAWLGRQRPFSTIGRVIERHVTEERVMGLLDRLFAKSEDDLLRGDLVEYALNRYDPAKKKYFGLLFMHIPPDLEKPWVFDGLTIDRCPPAETFAPGKIDRVLLTQCVRVGVTSGLLVLMLALLLWNPAYMIGRPSIEQIGLSSVSTAEIVLTEDVWGEKAAMETQGKLAERRQSLQDTLKADLKSSLPNGLFAALALALASAVIVVPRSINGVMARAAKPFQTQTNASVVLANYRQEEMTEHLENWYEQVKAVTGWDAKTPTLYIGVATGIMRVRNMIGAPKRGTEMILSANDAGQGGICVLGGTGAGKTTLVLMRVIKQWLELRKFSNEGNIQLKIGLFVTDAKGALAGEVLALCRKMGCEADLRTIGTKTAEGQFAVNLLEGLNPLQFHMALKNVYEAIGGGESSDPYWGNSAMDLAFHAGKLAYVFQEIDRGYELANIENMQPWSIRFIYKIGVNSNKVDEVMRDVVAAIHDPEQHRFIAKLVDDPTFWDSVEWLERFWDDNHNPSKTRGGILGQFEQLFGGFNKSRELGESFGAGGGERLLRVEECFDKLTACAVSDQDFGEAGNVVNVLIQYRIMHQSQVDFEADPQIAEKRKLLYAQDEAHSTISVSTTGLSHANYWNQSRGFGVIGLIATQSLASLYQKFSEWQVKNLFDQFRNKIILRGESEDTEYISKIIGEGPRSYVFSPNFAESYDSLHWDCEDPVDSPPARLSGHERVEALLSGLFSPAYVLEDVSWPNWRPIYETDRRFLLSGFGAMAGNAMQALRDAVWRGEDGSKSAYADGNHTDKFVKPSDIHWEGRDALVMIQRGGHVKVDYVELIERKEQENVV